MPIKFMEDNNSIRWDSDSNIVKYDQRNSLYLKASEIKK